MLGIFLRSAPTEHEKELFRRESPAPSLSDSSSTAVVNGCCGLCRSDSKWMESLDLGLPGSSSSTSKHPLHSIKVYNKSPHR